MTRKMFTASLGMLAAAQTKTSPPPSRMGIASTSYMTVWRPRDTLQFFEHCRSLGAAGIQTQLSSLDPAYVRKVRAALESAGMYFEVMAPLPRQGDAALLDKTLAAAKEAGALCARVGCLSGRRYETFSTDAEWQKFVKDSKNALRLAVPIAEKHKLRLALENHKDWTIEEHLALLKEFSSEYLGVLLDTGNNIALLDDPYELVERLAPYAYSTHIKDMGVEEYKDGFLLAEVPLGAGYLDMKRIVQTIRAARPDTRFTLEMITRNPLPIPVWTEKYWATFPNRPAARLSATFRTVRARAQRLPRMEPLGPSAQKQWEDDNVKQSLHHARELLAL